MEETVKVLESKPVDTSPLQLPPASCSGIGDRHHSTIFRGHAGRSKVREREESARFQHRCRSGNNSWLVFFPWHGYPCRFWIEVSKAWGQGWASKQKPP